MRSEQGFTTAGQSREAAALRLRGVVILILVAVASAYALVPSVSAQTSTVARTPDNRPNLEGIWQAVNTAAWDVQDHGARFGVPAGQGIVEGNEIPYQPWALAQKNTNYEKRASLDPEAKCQMPGVPRITYLPYPFQIFQSGEYIAIVYEYIHINRIVHLDGSAHPDPELIEFWMGDSRGHWEGNTLVVDVTNFTDKTWFDRAGNFHSANLHVVERYTRTGPDHLQYEATIEDPKVFTRPWKVSFPLYRRQEKNVQLLEYECYAYAEEQQ